MLGGTKDIMFTLSKSWGWHVPPINSVPASLGNSTLGAILLSPELIGWSGHILWQVQNTSHDLLSWLYSGYIFSHYESLFPTRDCNPFVRSGLYQLVIRVKGIRVCALHCVRAVTSIRIAFEVLSCRRGHHAFSE